MYDFVPTPKKGSTRILPNKKGFEFFVPTLKLYVE